MEIKCPKCNESFGVEAHAVILKDQVLYLQMKSESDLFSAKVIGQAIVHMEEIQRGVAKNMGIKVCVFIKSFELKPKEITIGFQIVNAS